MDRRTFLRSSAALSASMFCNDVSSAEQQIPPQAEHPMAPPVNTTVQQARHEPFRWEANGIVWSFEFQGDRVRLRHALPAGSREPSNIPASTDVSGLETSMHCTGEDIADHHGSKFTGASPGTRMRYVNHHGENGGKRFVLTHQDDALGLQISSVYEAFGDAQVVRRRVKVTNVSARPVGIEYVSSAMMNNFADPARLEDDLRIHFAYNSWQAEAQWHKVKPSELGLVQNGNFTVSGASFSTIGSWPCQSFLPLMMVENTALGVTWFWEVEHNGSWHAEMAQTSAKALYAYIGGPDAQHSQAWKLLRPGETYETVPVAVGCVKGGFAEAVAELTRYRRVRHMHPRSDMRQCPIVFNDVLLNNEQTTSNEMALIDAAADAGCEIFCMDAGWTSKPGENWWGAVGDWVADPQRFPGGLDKLTRYIRSRGLTPGLWIEPEVASPQSALAKRPDSWFLMRHGRRVLDHSRFHLDFRNPQVRAYTDSVFERLVRQYGIGYVKLDYNINACEGTETNAESFGQGLLEHNRAFLGWLDALLDRYPDLTIETVASGSMRMEQSMLSRAQLQSISDQDDYKSYSSIATGCSAVVLPEQLGVWVEPFQQDGPEVASCNMVNAMLGRIHFSGLLPHMPAESVAQVKRGFQVYKAQIRAHIPNMIPFYPLGTALLTKTDTPAALGIRTAAKSFLAVWRRDSGEVVHVPGKWPGAHLLYPEDLGIRVVADAAGLDVFFPKPNMGCIISTTAI